MTIEEWKVFHKQLDVCVAQFITETKQMPSRTTLLEFMEFSHRKTKQ